MAYSPTLELDAKNVALTASFTALVFVYTLFFSVAIVSTNGFFNLGESMVYLSAILGGPVIGFIAGGFGSALADVTLGYGQFAPGTFIIKGLEGFIVGYLFIVMKKYGKKQIKIVYSLFTFIFIGLAVVITSPSLYNLFTSFDFTNFGTIFSDFGSSNFDFYFTLYYPEGSDFFAPHEIVFTLSGFLFILISILLSGLLWISYLRLGERSIMILSCSVGGLIMVSGYFLYEVLFLNIPAGAAFVEIPFNITQALIGMAIAIPTVSYLFSLGIKEE